MGLSGLRLCVDSNSLTPLGPIPKQNHTVLFYSNNFTQFCKWLVNFPSRDWRPWRLRAVHLVSGVYQDSSAERQASQKAKAFLWLHFDGS